ncbi:hypothetical protein NLI96_g3806 [Meripilus lineatus]|uniref:Uncharacterized protein n=1 Tax=Meripilus lineatus TaxID=2056292 RepID=A0AAD5V661_9APHY|nr:hypothetical protein NLI96_g3806 [Physisporinus lineatus]
MHAVVHTAIVPYDPPLGSLYFNAPSRGSRIRKEIIQIKQNRKKRRVHKDVNLSPGTLTFNGGLGAPWLRSVWALTQAPARSPTIDPIERIVPPLYKSPIETMRVQLFNFDISVPHQTNRGFFEDLRYIMHPWVRPVGGNFPRYNPGPV